MNLIIDQGNTFFKTALFNGNELINQNKFDYRSILAFHKWLEQFAEKNLNLITSSVVNQKIEIGNLFKIKKEIDLNQNTPIPIQNLYHTPTTLGKDRLANAVGAWALNPNQNSLVVDMGTCIKYDIVTKKGEYLGGNISPGFKMRYKALNTFTDKLPLIDNYELNSTFGVDTTSSLQAGVQLGIENEINGFIQRFNQEFQPLTIFMTGGDTKYFDKYFKNRIFANPNLTLIGLNEILNYNA
ncbi:MAG: type III pantothenate kinase [Putridiphycobacter sp.]